MIKFKLTRHGIRAQVYVFLNFFEVKDQTSKKKGERKNAQNFSHPDDILQNNGHARPKTTPPPKDQNQIYEVSDDTYRMTRRV